MNNVNAKQTLQQRPQPDICLLLQNEKLCCLISRFHWTASLFEFSIYSALFFVSHFTCYACLQNTRLFLNGLNKHSSGYNLPSCWPSRILNFPLVSKYPTFGSTLSWTRCSLHCFKNAIYGHFLISSQTHLLSKLIHGYFKLVLVITNVINIIHCNKWIICDKKTRTWTTVLVADTRNGS